MAVVITLVMLYTTANIVERKESVIKNQDFIAEKQNIDVLFLGTSHVINGVYPMELWDSYGIVSYNLAGHSTPIASSYWVLKNALDYTEPKLVVIDCLAIRDVIKVSDNFDYTHICFDAFPLSLTKVQAVNDLLEDNTEHSKWDLLFPFSQYHNRWNQLSSDDFCVEYSSEKGAEMRVDLATPLYFDKIPSEQKIKEDTLAMEYLEKIIVECNERGIEVLLTYLPFPANPSCQEEANRVYDIADEYDVDYINFLDMDIVNYETDCYDDASHLNPSGARKVTDYLGRYIIDNFDVQNQRENTKYHEWFEDCERYQEKKNRKLMDIENPYIYMSMLTDHNYNIIIELTDKDILLDAKLCMLFDNLGIEYAKAMEAEYILLNNRTGQIEYLCEQQLSVDYINTGIGTFEKKCSDGNYSIMVDGLSYYDVLTEENQWVDMRTIVIDNRTKELVENLYYMHIEDENIEWNTILCRVK